MSEWTLTRLQHGLRERTDAVDAVVHGALAAPTRAGYRRWICDLYRFVSEFESKFAFTHHLDVAFIQARIKSGRLAADVLALGLTDVERERLARRCEVPDFSGPLEGVGWLFVVDRVLLGLPALRDSLTPVLADELAVAGSIFDVYDGELAERWIELGRMIERWLVAPSDILVVTAAARDALDRLEACFGDPVNHVPIVWSA